MTGSKSQWIKLSITVALASLSASLYFWRRKSKLSFSNGEEEARRKIQQLEASLKSALEKCAAERKGRIRAQQALRESLSRSNSDKLESSSYPMTPIAIVRSCFSTRNGTPRQPLLVPLAKASLTFDPARVPQASLEGLEGYSHCWIIYVFHLNTDLEKLWKHPSQSKFKAKVRVPRLKGERIGVFASRSPHRPCPIGLTVAKVEAVHGHTVLLLGVDLVDGTPVLDIKPYLPYCDNIQEATVPDWVKVDNVLAVASVNFSEGFSSSLADCWLLMEKKSLYTSPEEFQSLIRQVLLWDIRSVSQRTRPQQPLDETEAGNRGENHIENEVVNDSSNLENCQEDEYFENGDDIVYHLVLEGLDVSYRIDSKAKVLVERVTLASHVDSQ
ncbi:hypothetical protein CDL12_09105 [Handroanthus impetiginosus]|uniref:TsaA-like domain-containing protein n=1 Tax=Handroanthus impetiginosus TaxID=429701 RepID=A0A2G9HL32_9LAMI|nr:hypothetical protein CDL12_09105 [Handroanthus impetiginosus]